LLLVSVGFFNMHWLIRPESIIYRNFAVSRIGTFVTIFKAFPALPRLLRSAALSNSIRLQSIRTSCLPITFRSLKWLRQSETEIRKQADGFWNFQVRNIWCVAAVMPSRLRILRILLLATTAKGRRFLSNILVM